MVYNTKAKQARGGRGKILKGVKSRVWQTQKYTGTEDIKKGFEQDINKKKKRIKQLGKM